MQWAVFSFLTTIIPFILEALWRWELISGFWDQEVQAPAIELTERHWQVGLLGPSRAHLLSTHQVCGTSLSTKNEHTHTLN